MAEAGGDSPNAIQTIPRRDREIPQRRDGFLPIHLNRQISNITYPSVVRPCRTRWIGGASARFAGAVRADFRNWWRPRRGALLSPARSAPVALCLESNGGAGCGPVELSGLKLSSDPRLQELALYESWLGGVAEAALARDGRLTRVHRLMLEVRDMSARILDNTSVEEMRRNAQHGSPILMYHI